jgi:cysteinyl-tRNA synthetase
MVQSILDNGLAYEKNGSGYFDTRKLAEKDLYGKLSGRVIEDLLVETRDLKNQSEKRHPSDFAIWIKAAPENLMRWNSPWSVGFPGWHLECSAMSTKYLGNKFDIHGGGNDLKFPHHENEIAQNHGACNCAPANYWLHTNMLLMNGKKMSKSIDPETGVSNSITPNELFTGENPNISKGYSPMMVRFFMLQSHYRSTLDLTDAALAAAEKGYRRLMEGNKVLQALKHPGKGKAGALDQSIRALIETAHADMNDDFNAPKAMARLFELVSKINGLKAGHLSFDEISADTLELLKQTFTSFIFDIFGLKDDTLSGNNEEADNTLDGLMQMVIKIRQSARANKDWGTADTIRDTLTELGIQLKDGKDGTGWSKN